jgi:hypothetical protein
MAMLYTSSPEEQAALQTRNGSRALRGQRALAQQLEVLGLAEKIGLVGGQQVDGGLTSSALPLAEHIEVVAVAVEPVCCRRFARRPLTSAFLVSDR